LGGSKGELDAANSGYFAVRGLLAKSVAEAARFRWVGQPSVVA
jgi:hypothetical protein